MADSRIQVPPPCDLTLGMACTDKSTPGVTVWTMTVDERFSNPAGIMQGGFMAAFADSAMGAAAVTFASGRKVFAANAEMKISFLRAVPVGTALTATSRVISGGKRTAFVEVEVVDESGALLAKASSTYLYTERAQPPGT